MEVGTGAKRKNDDLPGNAAEGNKSDVGIRSRLYENVLKGNKRTMIDDVKAFLAPTVATRPSTTMSSFVNPRLTALSYTV